MSGELMQSMLTLPPALNQIRIALSLRGTYNFL